jgi:hypothetical protein
MQTDDDRALWQIRQTQVLEAKLKYWSTTIILMSIWLTVLAMFWKWVLL